VDKRDRVFHEPVRKAGTPAAQAFSNKGFTLASGLFVAVLAAYALFQSPFFRLAAVEVVGAESLSAADIAAWTGLEMGENLLELDMRAISEAIHSHPQVKEARVRRKLPAALRVELVERRPVAYLAAGDAFWAVDGEGVALFETAALTSSRPLITVDAPLTPAAGKVVDHPGLGRALEFARSLSAKGLANLSEIHAASDAVTAYTRDGISISLGGDGSMSDKARVLEELLDEIQRRQLSVAHIDLRHPKSPVFRDKR